MSMTVVLHWEGSKRRHVKCVTLITLTVNPRAVASFFKTLVAALCPFAAVSFWLKTEKELQHGNGKYRGEGIYRLNFKSYIVQKLLFILFKCIFNDIFK